MTVFGGAGFLHILLIVVSQHPWQLSICISCFDAVHSEWPLAPGGAKMLILLVILSEGVYFTH